MVRPRFRDAYFLTWNAELRSPMRTVSGVGTKYVFVQGRLNLDAYLKVQFTAPTEESVGSHC